MADLYAVSFDEILDLLEELANALACEINPYIKEAYEACLVSNPMFVWDCLINGVRPWHRWDPTHVFDPITHIPSRTN
jgi:hypothetical protein